MIDLNHRSAVTLGGWDPRYATTLAVATHDHLGAALVDTNSDSADIDLDLYQRDDDGIWHSGGSGNVGEAGTSLGPDMAVAWGQAEPDRTVDVHYAGRRHQVTATKTGWWLFLAPATDGGYDSPAVSPD